MYVGIYLQGWVYDSVDYKAFPFVLPFSRKQYLIVHSVFKEKRFLENVPTILPIISYYLPTFPIFPSFLRSVSQAFFYTI